MPATATARRPAMSHHRPRPPEPPPGRRPRAALALGAVPTAPGCARAWARAILREWGLAGLSDASDLVVSELATNALLASLRERVPFFWMVLTLGNGDLVIHARDFCPGIPQPRQAGEEDEDGRGLLLVQAMSSRSGWYPAGDGTPGKVVYAVLKAAPAAAGTPAAGFIP